MTEAEGNEDEESRGWLLKQPADSSTTRDLRTAATTGAADERREFRSVGPDFTQVSALQRFAGLAAPAPPDLHVWMNSLTAVDAMGGLILSVATRAHLMRSPENTVELWEPTDVEQWAHVASLLGPLPERASWCGNRSRDGHLVREVLVPAMPLADVDDIEIIETYIRATAPHASVPVREARVLSSAFAELARAAIRNSPGSDISPIVCIGRRPDTPAVTLAVWNGGPGLGVSDDPVATLRSMLDDREDQLSELSLLADDAARKRMKPGVLVASSIARATWQDGPWIYRPVQEQVPGFLVAFTLQLQG